MEQENNKKDSDNPAGASAKSLSPEKDNLGVQNPTEASTKSQSSAMNNGKSENPGETPIKPESSSKKTPKSLRAKSEVKKKSSASTSLRAKKAKGNFLAWGRNKKKKNKSVVQDKETNKNEHNNDQNQNSREEKLQNKGAHERHIGKGQDSQKSQERDAGASRSVHNQRSERKHSGTNNSSKSQKNKGKLDGKEKSKKDERKKEKLGGLIFMCSAKTKPDCFRYQVMGVTASKKDLVLGVKPGLKLFLYDFDLKLMYGIYKASSSGGMRLEPKAFGGSFPVQVRFSIHKDCFPLPESVFKRAIKDNYDKKNKFNIELTVRQVRKLSELFRPAVFQSLQSAAMPIHSPSKATIRDKEVYEGLRESRPYSDRDTFARVSGHGRNYPVVPRERDQRIEHLQVVSTHREEAPRDLYMSEKEYRTYGLQRERRNLTPPHVATSTLDPYQRDLEREHLLRQPAALYADIFPVHRETVLADPLYSTQRELQTYNLGGRSELPPAAPSVSAAASGSAVTALDPCTRDSYYSYRYGASSATAHLLPARREEVSSLSYYADGRRETYLPEADPLCRRDRDQLDKLYLKYGVNPLSDYTQAYQGIQPDTMPAPVSSRYSFAGSSVSYR